MNLNELYLPYEKKIIPIIFNDIISNFRNTGRAPYFDKYGNQKIDEYLELDRISSATETIYFKRRNNNPVEWEVPFSKLKNAIKATVRFGRILRQTDYLTMDGKSNFIGTPLHLLVSLLPQEEYQKYSLSNRYLTHQKFGKVKILGIDYPENHITIESQPKPKKIKMDFWEITEDEFNGVVNAPRA